MDRGPKIATAAGILLGGIALALLFRHDPPRVGPAAPTGSDRLVLRGRVEPPSNAAPAVFPGSPSLAAAGAPRPAQTAPTPPASPWDGAPPPMPRSFPGVPRPSVKPAVRHKIVDGDTLPALAERYLGARERAGEIYQANRDVLASPELLPIGGELKIPPRDAPPTNGEPPLVPIPSHGT